MNLFEVTDEFASPKTTPQEDLEYLAKREKNLRYQMSLVTREIELLKTKIVGNVIYPTWNMTNPNDPEHKENIDRMIKGGFIAIMHPKGWGSFECENVYAFIPKVPQNEPIAKKLQRLLYRETELTMFEREIPSRIKRAKGRLSAWKRKQPTYVARATGKELKEEIQKKLEHFITTEKLWQYPITNAYYWAKNKMIVFEISVRRPASGKTPYDEAKTVVKPAVTKFLEELGYSQFRVLERFVDRDLTNVKIQIDDVEARDKEKATEDETE